MMILAAIALSASFASGAPQLPAGVTCEQVRTLVKEYGRAVAFG